MESIAHHITGKYPGLLVRQKKLAAVAHVDIILKICEASDKYIYILEFPTDFTLVHKDYTTWVTREIYNRDFDWRRWVDRFLQENCQEDRTCFLCCEQRDEFVQCIKCLKEVCHHCVPKLRAHKCPYCRNEIGFRNSDTFSATTNLFPEF